MAEIFPVYTRMYFEYKAIVIFRFYLVNQSEMLHDVVQVIHVLSWTNLKPGYMGFAMAGDNSTVGIRLLLTRRVSYC